MIFPSATDRRFVQRVGVDEVEVVAGRNVGQLRAEQGRDVGIFAVVIKDVGHELTLLEHIRTAGEVGRPGLGRLRPRFMPGEPLAEGPEAEARDLVVDGLVDRGVDHEPVQAHGQQAVGGGLQRFGGEGPGAAAGGQGFGGHQVLAVDVGDRGGLAHVGVVLRRRFGRAARSTWRSSERRRCV